MKQWWPIVAAVCVLLASFLVIYAFKGRNPGDPLVGITSNSDTATNDELPVGELTPQQQPKVSMRFEPDGHYVVVTFDNLHAFTMEYNLIYDAKVRGNDIQTGVSGNKNILGQTVISQRQLLGTESSGKFTFHQSIKNANLELTLRDAQGRSIYTGTFPFEVQAGKEVVLKKAE